MQVKIDPMVTRPLSRRAVVLGGLLKRIGNFGKMRTFRDRLVFQKTTYLLQAWGIYLGYHFSWYVYGPYSPGLTRDGYALLTVFDDLDAVTLTSGDAEQRFQRFVEWLGERKADEKWLEAVASVHSLRKLYPHLSKDDVIARVAAKQPYFSREVADRAWRELEAVSLLRS